MTKDKEVEAIKAILFLATMPPEVKITINNKYNSSNKLEGVPVHWLILPVCIHLLYEKGMNGIAIFKAIYERTNKFHKSYEIANVENMAKHFLKVYKNTKEDKEAMAKVFNILADVAIKFYHDFDYEKFTGNK